MGARMKGELSVSVGSLKDRLRERVLRLWYQKKLSIWLYWLIPISLIWSGYATLRKTLYDKGIFKQHKFQIPIVIVGNLTLGGTGKTPLVIHIAKLLKQHGFNPGIVSRGYQLTSTQKGNNANYLKSSGFANNVIKYPISVNANSDPEEVGDEPALFAKRLFCPIMVDPKRKRAVQAMIDSGQVDVIISDDGLQHYAMGRSIEIVVIDGKRRLGNGWCLPAGPLREPKSRLKSVDMIVVNGSDHYENNEYDMELRPRMVYNGKNVSEQSTLISFQGQKVHAVAGIGHPDRFFEMLRNYGMEIIAHPFPDHHRFMPMDLEFHDEYPVLMTEKDAVKCFKFMNPNHWVLAVDAIVNPLFDTRLLTRLQEYKRG